MDVAQPIEMYDKVRAEVEKQLGQPAPAGCLMHLVTRTDDGFRVTEVWESHEAADRFGDEIMRPIIERVAGPDMAAQGPPPSVELEVHRLALSEQSSAAV
ncbi:MAG: hypothetical protein M3Z02_08910 [Actinomycetota bacterium]|nr:hypothetical protein [Actinomycetota bacterium]